MGEIFFTADTHYGDERKFESGEFARRFGYRDCKDRDEHIVESINRRVCPEDTLIHLGDVCSDRSYETQIREFHDRLAVKHMVIIPGNNDNFIVPESPFYEGLRDFFDSVGDGKDLRSLHVTARCIKLLGRKFVLSHYPLLNWPGKKMGAIHLHGHLHGLSDGVTFGLPSFNGPRLALDLFIDSWGGPVSIREIIKIVDEVKADGTRSDVLIAEARGDAAIQLARSLYGNS